MGVSLLVADMTRVYNGFLLGHEEWIWHSQGLKVFSQPPEGRCPTGLSVLKAVSHPLMRDLLVAIGKLIGYACVVAAEQGTG